MPLQTKNISKDGVNVDPDLLRIRLRNIADRQI